MERWSDRSIDLTGLFYQPIVDFRVRSMIFDKLICLSRKVDKMEIVCNRIPAVVDDLRNAIGVFEKLGNALSFSTTDISNPLALEELRMSNRRMRFIFGVVPNKKTIETLSNPRMMFLLRNTVYVIRPLAVEVRRVEFVKFLLGLDWIVNGAWNGNGTVDFSEIERNRCKYSDADDYLSCDYEH